MGRAMEKTGASLLIAVAGLLVMICGFAGYAFVDPSTVWIAVFAAGLIAMIAGYVLVQIEGRRTARALDEALKREKTEGYVYYLDGEPEVDDAWIEDLTRN